MRSVLIVGVALVLAVVPFVALRSGGEGDSVSVEASKPTSNEAVEEAAGPESAAPAPARAPAEAEPPTAARAPEVAATSEEEDDDPRAVLRGRFVLPGGVPAVGVDVELHGWRANQDRVMEHGLPESWEDPATTTDAEGRFELRFDPPRAYQFTLDAKLAGYAGAGWRWGELLPGSVTELGTVELAATGSVRVRMETADGAPIRGGWRVYAESAGVAGAEREPTRVSVPLDPTTSTALLEDLPPGTAKLTAYSRISNWIDGPTVDVEAGRKLDVVLRYEGPDESRRLVVVVFTSPFHTLRVEPDSIRLSGGGMEPRTSAKIERSSQSYVFEDLPAGGYTVEIDDPRFEPWSRTGLEPGSRVDAKLRGSAALRVEVVDAAAGEAVPRYDLRLRLEGTNSFPNTFQLLAPKDEPPRGGLFDGVPSVPATLLVAAEGYTELELPLEGLAPGETRPVVAELARGASVRGRVVAADGTTPVAGAQVQLAPLDAPARLERPGTWSSGDDERARVVHTKTDAAGRFELASAPSGTWTLRAIANPWLTASVEDFVLADGEDRELTLTLPPSCSLIGRLIAPEGVGLDGLRLSVQLAAAPVVEDVFHRDRLDVELAADGSFSSGPLPPGEEATLRLAGPEVSLPHGFHSSFGAQVPELELATVTLEAGLPLGLEFDLRERWFGSIEVRATRAGEPLAGYVVEAQDASPDGRGHTGALTGADGRATIGFVVPGDWRVSVRPVDASWTFERPAPVAVVAGRESRCAVGVVVAAGEVLLVDQATGEPLRDVEVVLEDPAGRGRSLRTDAEGRLELQLAPGSYTLKAGSFWRSGPEAPLEWTAGGPLSERVELELPEEDG